MAIDWIPIFIPFQLQNELVTKAKEHELKLMLSVYYARFVHVIFFTLPHTHTATCMHAHIYVYI